MPPGSAQTLATWDEAADLILARVRTLAGPGGERWPIVVGITGPVGSGKSTLADRLGGVRVSTDDYLPDYERLPEHERDEPRHAALEMLAHHLASLRRREPVEAPVWCFHAHRRTGIRTIEPGPLVVCEGLFALAAPVRSAIDLGVFVDAARAERWSRWERIERQGERGWGVDRAKTYFDRVAEPTFARFAPEYRGAAEIIVINDQRKGRAPSDAARGSHA